MGSKSFVLFALSIFALVLVMGIGSAFDATISAANPTIVSSSFTPQVGSELVINTEAFIGRTTNRTVGTPLGEITNTIFWKIIIDGPSTLTTDMVDFDEMGFLDPPATVSHIETFHYPFSSDGSGNLAVIGSCDANNTHSNTCVHDIGFSLDANDVFHNADKIKFNSNAPLGTYTITYQLVHTTPDPDTFSDDIHQVTFTLTSPTSSVPSEVTSCNVAGNPGQLDVRRIDFNNNGLQHRTYGDDDVWFPFEEIQVDIEIENDGNFDVDDISVEWGVWDSAAREWVIDLDEEDEINLNDGDQDTLTFSLTIDDDVDMDLDQLQGGTDDYVFYVVARGIINDNDAGSLDDDDTCVVGDETVTIEIESDFVVLGNFNIPEQVQCSESVTITADAWNIGDNDQDSVSVFVTNSELGVREDIDVGDIDSFDKQQVSLTFTVPADAEEKIHRLSFEVFDEDNDLYENDFDDDPAEFSVPLTVSGNCGAAGTGEVSVFANIASGGKAGQELIVKATVTNTGASQKVYSLNVAGFDDWASSFSLDQNSLLLGAGQSRDVLVTLDVNDDAAGSRTFFLEFVSGGDLVRQPVTVAVTEARGAGGITGLVTGGNWYLWGIGLLNVLLVIVIIFVAVRIAKK